MDSDNEIFDLCIVGSGPAGLILTLEYCRLNPNKKVLLVEYGHKRQSGPNKLDDSIEITNPVNHHNPYECTNKGFGGSSATWGGRCVMYDEIDFEERAVLNGGCTWDKELFTDAKKYLKYAAKYFECGRPVFDLYKTVAGKQARPIADNFKPGSVTDSTVERWSKPTRFGKTYEKAIAEQPNLKVMFAGEAREFAEPQADGTVSYLLVRNVDTQELVKINARNFVLAAGAQESTRILLRNKQLFSNLPNVPQALGKYYQGHLSGKIASVRFKGDPKNTDYGFVRDRDGIYLRRRFQFTDEYLLKNDLLNTAIWLDNPLYHDPKHKSGAMSFMYLAMLMPVLGKKLAPPAIAHSITKGQVNGVGKHVGNILKSLPGSITKPASIFYKRYCLERKLPGVFLYNPSNFYALHFHSEQVPDVNNSMQLGDDGEKLVINYSLTDADINSVIKLHKELDANLRSSGCGELEYWFNEDELPDTIRKMSKDGLHQVGTTRIAKTPSDGVVDENLKVWGTKNVFVCSSSVFPTSGQANPTFMLGTFAARLANHLTGIAANKRSASKSKLQFT